MIGLLLPPGFRSNKTPPSGTNIEMFAVAASRRTGLL
jgi:hypothetical protein